MATFIKLTNAYRRSARWVNLDLVREMQRLPAVDSEYQGKAPERTALSFAQAGHRDSWDITEVVETPEQIVAMLAEHRLANGGAS